MTGRQLLKQLKTKMCGDDLFDDEVTLRDVLDLLALVGLPGAAEAYRHCLDSEMESIYLTMALKRERDDRKRATLPAAAEERRDYFCSCGAACTEAEYAEHVARGHDAAELSKSEGDSTR